MLKTVDLDPATNVTDYDIGMGMLSLLGATTAFGQWPLTRAVGILHCALMSGNFRIFVGSNNRPSAAIIWAYLNEETAEDYLKKGYLSDLQAWNSGNDLWFMHAIAEGGKIKDVIKDAVDSPTFQDQDQAFMLRVSASGRRRIVSFTRQGMHLVRTLEK